MSWCSLNGKCLMVPILCLIIIGYEFRTRALLNFLTGRENEKNTAVQRSPGHECDRLVRMADYDQLPAVMLASYPGSGNT